VLAPGDYTVDVSDATTYSGVGVAPNILFQIRASKKP
jgi:hypothetical protein